MVAKNIEGRQKAFDAIEKLIADGEPIRFLELSKKIGVPPTTIKRVFNEFFKDKGIKGRARGSGKIIDEIIASGVTDKDQIKKIAKDKYKVNIEDRAIIKKINLATDFSVEQYADDFRKMTSDPNYVPKYVQPATVKGMTTNQRAAKKIVKTEVDGFEEKLLANENKRKKLKRAADPEKRAFDLASRSERRTTRRLKEKDVALTEAEKKINLDQRRFTKEVLNNPIRKNPNLVLNNEDLMNRLSITVSNNGDIIKLNKPPGLTKESLIKRGLFEIDHQRDIYKEGKMKNLPYNRNPIMGPHNRSNGFKATAERYIKKNPNPNDPKVQKILQVAEELKVTLQPDIPEGIFKTKGIGYKQIGGPVEKFKNFAEPILNKIGALDVDKLKTAFSGSELIDSFINKVKSVPGGCRAVVTRALGGPIDKCEAIIKADPEKAALKLNNAITATKGPLKNLKEDSQKLIRLYRGEGFKSRSGPTIKEMAKTFNVSEAEAKKKLLSGQWFTSDPVAASSYTDRLGKTKYVDVTPREFLNFKKYVDRVNKTKSLSGGERFAVNTGDKLSIIPRYKLKEFEEAGKLKSQRNIFKDFNLKSGYVDRPEGVLSYDSVKGGFIDPAQPNKVVTQSDIKQYALDNPMEVKVGEPAKLPKPNKSVLKTVGKTLAAVGAPLPTALIDTYFINEQIKQDKTTSEIVSNPLNWLGLATMSPLSRAAGIDKAGKVNTALRLGLNPGTIRGISRFVGLPGLALSTAMTAYDQYTKYKNQEGFIYKLFNKEES